MKLVRSRLNWAGHVERMGDEKLAKKADVQKVEGKRGVLLTPASTLSSSILL